MKPYALCGLVFLAGLTQACGQAVSSASPSNPAPLPVAAALPSDEEVHRSAIRFLEARVKADPDDMVAQNKLGGYYLQSLRETGQLTYLDLARRTAQASLKSIPAEMNSGGLILLTQTEFAAHQFAEVRIHAEQLLKLDSRKALPYQLLGDAQLELGDYEAARVTFAKLNQLAPGQLGTETRLGRLAALHGDHAREREHYENALRTTLAVVPLNREAVAWCRWQLGETAFSTGDYRTAEQHYREALTTFPNYYRALAGLGRTRAAQGDLAGAIEQYEYAARQLPEPPTVAALGDLYQLAGRTAESATQYALCEQLAQLGRAHGELYSRHLALFYADHGLKAAEAYQAAQHEYTQRRDIYGADTLAWTAFKADKLAEAQTAIKEALRLGTQDARLFYHAGLIALAAGDTISANAYLQRAAKLNPQFDPLQAKQLTAALAH